MRKLVLWLPQWTSYALVGGATPLVAEWFLYHAEGGGGGRRSGCSSIINDVISVEISPQRFKKMFATF